MPPKPEPRSAMSLPTLSTRSFFFSVDHVSAVFLLSTPDMNPNKQSPVLIGALKFIEDELSHKESDELVDIMIRDILVENALLATKDPLPGRLLAHLVATHRKANTLGSFCRALLTLAAALPNEAICNNWADHSELLKTDPNFFHGNDEGEKFATYCSIDLCIEIKLRPLHMLYYKFAYEIAAYSGVTKENVSVLVRSSVYFYFALVRMAAGCAGQNFRQSTNAPSSSDYRAANETHDLSPLMNAVDALRKKFYCAHCGLQPPMLNISSEPAPLLLCGGCRAARYCSKACQKNAWPLHKKTCAK